MSTPDLGWLGLYAREPDYAARLILSAAANGNLDAQARLGQILLDGRGIARDPQLALRWFTIAADAGHVAARNMLGRCWQMGWGCAIDLAVAARYYRMAADQRDDWGRYNYANMLAKGWGVTRDLAAALSYYQLAANNGHAKAMNLVGRFHEEGWEVPPDLDVAFDWYQRSALAGDFRGQCSYASQLVARGKLDEALVWLRRAMTTATVPFLQTMASALLGSPHVALRELALQMRGLAEQRLKLSASACSDSTPGAYLRPTA